MSVLTLTRRYEIECAHQLVGLREGHKCGRIHGHNYVIELSIARGAAPYAALDNGMVLDAEAIDVCVLPVLRKLDHHLLNELGGTDPALRLAFAPMNDQPTAENMALYLWKALGFMDRGHTRMTRVRVYENAHLWAEVCA